MPGARRVVRRPRKSDGKARFGGLLPVVPGLRIASTLVFVHPTLGVKDSLDDAPDIDDVRPPHCPGCSAVSLPVSESIVIVGHGVRTRRLRWKTGLGNQVRDGQVFVRRFLCRRCGVTITVLPTTVEPRRRYTRDLIIFLLAVWALDDVPAADIRQLVCDEPDIDWPQLRRWAMGLPLPEGRRVGRGPPRRHARRVARIYAGCAPPETREGLTLAQRAFVGAAYVR